MKTTQLPLVLTGFFAALALGACCSQSECASTPEAPSTPAVATSEPGESYELLSRHDTAAVFSGTREHKCMGRSMLCPDQCGHSGTLAVFRIEKYNAYEKPGKYGDPQTAEFMIMLNSTTGETEVPPAIAEKIRSLQPGEKVRLVWEHIYVTNDSGQFPRRVIRELSPR